jgi:hypothetical protein
VRPLPALATLGLFVVASRVALAQDAAPPAGEAPPLPPPEVAQVQPATTPTTTNVQAAPGTGGLTVVAPLAGGGSITAVGCSAVSVSGHSTEVRPGAPATAAGPCPVAYAAPRPRYAPDGGRKAAIITAPIVYGIGAFVSGVSYLSNHDRCGGSNHGEHCSDASASLVAYGSISAVVPSIPRFVVGDTVRGIVYSAARGGSIATAALIDWGKSDDAWMGPFLLGFGAPVALAIVDMATTPHREDLEDNPGADAEREHAQAAPAPPQRARITGVAPVALGDRENKPRGGGLSLTGTF